MILSASGERSDCVTVYVEFTTPLMVGIFGIFEYRVEIYGCRESSEESADMPGPEMSQSMNALLDDIGMKVVGESPPCHIRITPIQVSEEARNCLPRDTHVSAVIVNQWDGQVDNFHSVFPGSTAVVVEHWLLNGLCGSIKYRDVSYNQTMTTMSPQWRHFCSLMGYNPKEPVRSKETVANESVLNSMYRVVQVDPTELKRSIEAALQLPFVKDILLPPEGDTIRVVFSDAVNTDSYGDEHPVRSPEMIMLWGEDGYVDITIRANHPHVTPSGDVCWGGFAPMIDDVLETNDIEGVVILVWEFLNSYNPEDAYFRWESPEEEDERPYRVVEEGDPW